MRNISYLLHFANHPPKLLNLLPIGKLNDCRGVCRSLGYPHNEPYHEAVKRVVARIIYFSCKYCQFLRFPGNPFKESGKKESSGRSGRQLKVKLGVMPDFAGSEKKGLRIDGVTKDSPADKGGMKKGDIITGINGMTVGNIYEYMSRLQKLKHGMTVNVEVIREGKNQVLIIQL